MVITDRVVRYCWSNEIAWNQLCTLMDKLVECMLAVGARFAPNNGSGLVVHTVSLAIDVFTVTFHISLLEVGRKAVHILVVREYRVALRFEKVIVPNAQ